MKGEIEREIRRFFEDVAGVKLETDPTGGLWDHDSNWGFDPAALAERIALASRAPIIAALRASEYDVSDFHEDVIEAIATEILGDSLVTVEKTYAKHCPDDLREAVDMISGK